MPIYFLVVGNKGGFAKEMMSRWTFQAIFNATVSVDSFFTLSGLLCVYLFLKDFERRDLGLWSFFISVPILYLHRYIRYEGGSIGKKPGSEIMFKPNCKRSIF